jgi:uncharacterized membrane protein YoaK (UPF0700 family)
MTAGAQARRDTIVPLLLLMAATTGLVDAVSILGLGHVFTAVMTGNVVFLGFALAGAPGFSWQYCLTALFAFLVGAASGGRLFLAHGHRRRRWLTIATTIEAGLLVCAALVGALAFGAAGSIPVMILFTGLAMGLRNTTVRQLKVPDITVTVLTMTITGIAADSSLAGGSNPNVARRMMAVAAILSGAFIGALLVIRTGVTIPLLAAAAGTLLPTLALARDVSAS